MSRSRPFRIDEQFVDLPRDRRERHETLVNCFGQFIFWLRNWSLDATRTLLESEEARQELGSIRRDYYEGLAKLSPEQRHAALLCIEETLNGFGERLAWFFGGSSNDLKLGPDHSIRFQVQLEIVDTRTNEIIETDTISKGGKKFFGSNWGRWLNRYGKRQSSD